MLRSYFKYVCILYFIFITSVLSVSFGDVCSDHFSCHSPLVCSNSSTCVCPTATSFWNSKQNTCLSCPQGWIEWQQKKCLLFIAPSQGGIVYDEARNVCMTQLAQLLHIGNAEDFIRLAYKTDELLRNKHANAVTKFLNKGAWIDFTDGEQRSSFVLAKYLLNIDRKQTNSYDWCETEYEDDIVSWNDCIRIMKQVSDDNSDRPLCLSHVQCNRNLSYICEKSAQIQDNPNDTKHHGRLLNIVGDLVGNLLFPTQATLPPTQAPQIIYHTPPPQQLLAQSSSSSNTILYIAIAVVVIIIVFVILCCCCFGGGFFLWKSDTTSTAPNGTSRPRRRRDRTSMDSTASDGTN